VKVFREIYTVDPHPDFYPRAARVFRLKWKVARVDYALEEAEPPLKPKPLMAGAIWDHLIRLLWQRCEHERWPTPIIGKRVKVL
jgi:hypothetical protein